MDLSLEEASAILGKTRRQVLYLIKQDRLPAKKVGGRWSIDRADLQTDDDMRQRSTQRQDRLKAVVEDALTPGHTRRYTLRDLKAVQVAMPVYRDLSARGNGSEQAAMHMRQCLDPLAVESTATPMIFLGYRVSRAGISSSRKLRRRLRRRIRAAASKGEDALFRTIRSYQGLLLFP